MASRKDESPPGSLLDGDQPDAVRATGAELGAAFATREAVRDPPRDLGRIDTDRQTLPSELMQRPLAAGDLRRELSDRGFSRIDTLPDGFADILERRTLEPGDVVGRHYQLLEVLGGGAMGHVFVAENRAIGSRVAVKVLKPELLANPEFRQRFQHEAQAVGSIEHPNVARFLDVVVGDPTFLVMEYVPGPTLAMVLARERAMSIPRALHLATRLCWGLDAAHAAGVIHRDLKPANVILTADRELGETPKLIDFGLAKIAAVAGAEQLTRSGQIIGTPTYMSPEQIAGREVDGRSDVYALACLLYEMIAGRPPFVGDDDVQTLYRQLHEPPEPLSRHAAAVPATLDRVLARALSKKPDERYASMQELARALNGAVERRRDADAPPWLMTRGRRPGRMAVAFAAGVALTAGTWALRGRTRPALVAATGGALLVATQPPGASVTVDGRSNAETTPTAIVGVARGDHLVRATLPGRTPVEQQVHLGDGERALVQLVLPTASHPVRIDTVPSGALVYLDGVLQIGETPLGLTVADDEFHLLRIEKNGFELTSRAITPDDHDAAVTINLVPEKSERGTLMLESDTVAEVWIDGQDSGFMSPTVFRLAGGEHTLQLRDGDQSRSAPVKLRIRVGRATHLVVKGTGG